jgi:radical SAM protein with 4Fe4S-binding SPASM domain
MAVLDSIIKIKRYWKVALSYALGLSRSLAGPIAVHIETTNICNFRCVYCPQSNPDQHFQQLGRGKMSYAAYQTILDKILYAWPVREIVLTRDGEPLVHPELDKFINYAAAKGLIVTIGSNGSYFTEERTAQLIDSGLSKVKGDFCTNRIKYENLRRGGQWESVLAGYRTVVEYAIRQRKKFHLALVDLNTYDLADRQEIKRSLQELRQLFPYPPEYLSITRAMMHNSFNEAAVILSSSKKISQPRYNLCHHPWIELVIDYRGNAVGCCRDLRSEYIIGNILECSDVAAEIWNGKSMRYLRKHLARKSPQSMVTCRKCDLPYGISYAGRGVLNKLIRYLRR